MLLLILTGKKVSQSESITDEGRDEDTVPSLA